MLTKLLLGRNMGDSLNDNIMNPVFLTHLKRSVGVLKEKKKSSINIKLIVLKNSRN